MASPDYTALVYTTTFVDNATTGTPLNANTFTTRSNDLANAINNHINGKHQDGTAGNRHATMDLLDYNSANIGTEYQLLETTAYANTATNTATANTAWQRFDMFAALFKAVLGGTGTLTARKTAYDALAGGADLTTLYGLLHGGSPTFGSIVAIANNSTTAGVQVRAPSGDPASGYLARWSNNAGTVDKAAVDYSGLGIFYGGVSAVAPSTALPAVRALSSDNVARNVVSLRYNNNTENGSLWSDGSAILTQMTMNGVTAPALSAAGKSSIYTTTAGVVMVSQNGGAYVPLVGAASASGTAGSVQVAAAGNAFTSDHDSFYYDATNHRLGLGLGASPTVGTTLDMLGAFTLRGIAVAGLSNTGTAILAYDTGTSQLQASVNHGAFTSLVYASTVGSQNIGVTGTGSQIVLTAQSPASGTVVHGDLIVDAGGAIRTQGAAAGIVVYDRNSNTNYALLYRNTTDIFFGTSENSGLPVWDIVPGTGALRIGGSTAPNAMLHVTQPSGGTGDVARVDASAVTNGILEGWDRYGHEYQTQAAAPTIAAGTGAGTSPTLVTVTGTDQAGYISITTGTAPAGTNAALCTVTFRNAYTTTPRTVLIEPYNTSAGNLARNQDVFVTQTNVSATQFVVATGATALAASTAYVWQYRVL